MTTRLALAIAVGASVRVGDARSSLTVSRFRPNSLWVHPWRDRAPRRYELAEAPVLIRCGEGDAAASVSRCIDLAIEMGSTSLVVDLGDHGGACAALLGVLLRAGRRLKERGGASQSRAATQGSGASSN